MDDQSRNEEIAGAIVSRMLEDDAFSRWLGLEQIVVRPGYCKLSMRVRPEMANGFGIAHGGISYSLADSALAFASNSRGRHAVSIDTSIAHLLPVQVGDQLTAVAGEESLGQRIGHYVVRVTNQHEALVALFRGTVYRRSEPWEV